MRNHIFLVDAPGLKGVRQSLLGLILLLWSFSGMASESLETLAVRKNALPQNMLSAYQTECASCHLAYPPGMLPKQSWTRLMQGLDTHFGADASLDSETIQEISHWLDAQAGTYKRVDPAPPEDRISKSSWFVRKHKKIQDEVWLRPSVRSPANCVACHTQAAQGDYRERNILIPKN